MFNCSIFNIFNIDTNKELSISKLSCLNLNNCIINYNQYLIELIIENDTIKERHILNEFKKFYKNTQKIVCKKIGRFNFVNDRVFGYLIKETYYYRYGKNFAPYSYTDYVPILIPNSQEGVLIGSEELESHKSIIKLLKYIRKDYFYIDSYNSYKDTFNFFVPLDILLNEKRAFLDAFNKEKLKNSRKVFIFK